MFSSLNTIIKFLIYVLPVALVFSIFIADFIIVFVSVLFIIDQINKKNFVNAFKNKYFFFFLLFWLYLIINSIFSYDFKTSLSRSLPYIRFGILFVIISYYLKDNKFRLNFFKFSFIFLLLLCVDSIVQLFLGYNLIGFKLLHNSRVSGFFYDELVLGSFLLRMYPIFLISLIFIKKDFFQKNLYLLLLLLSIYSYAVIISGERTAFFNFLVFNIILFFFFFKIKYFKYFISFLLIVPFIIFTVNSNKEQILKRYLLEDLRENISKKGKIVIFSAEHENHYISAYKIFKSYPLLGSGLKTFRHMCKEPNHHPIGCSTHPHNIFMQFLSELGLIGILFYLFTFFYFLLWLLKLFFLRFNSNNYESIPNPALIISIISIIMSLWPFSPSGNYFNNWISILNFLPIGLLIFYDKKNIKF
tara:strand:+ start:931 stop:2178 length:1248 start_codon:yes stop_codon:yes gene_type:complete